VAVHCFHIHALRTIEMCDDGDCIEVISARMRVRSLCA
jgi:hypothetical protein